MSGLSRLRKCRNFLFCPLFFLFSCSGFCQKFEVLYAQFDGGIDTATFLPSPFYPNPDTLAKWIFLYANGKSLIKQTEDTPYEKKSYLVSKTTGNLDNIISYNMSKNNVHYNDYLKGETRELSYFFDIKYLIEDKLPRFEWKMIEGEKTILNYYCKQASARYPIDKNLLFDVWYTEDIPAVGGPMDLNGLPGLILEVSRNGHPFYKVLAIKRLPDDAKILIEKPLPNEKAITLGEYQKIRFGVPFVNENTKPPNKTLKKN